MTTWRSEKSRSPYADGEKEERPSAPRSVTTASVIVVFGVIVLVAWLGRGPGPGESAGEYYAKLLLFTLLGELVLLIVATLLSGLTRGTAPDARWCSAEARAC